ncbi:hypothetical protein [Franzmannia qiaohouensis]|uniref:Uncharacterized protein n=1 Tax=Franzmannia qiaohouensis TaxID=1329370 RepID=A0ABU1HAV8_9GAMM|nr:hypothetical protein [Halomonas qiaohouensis]MDR5904009.1 hypothetical protein [Halomonas qiaohouensis]
MDDELKANRYSEHDKQRDDALVSAAIDALRALENRLEELAPGITEDPDNVLPESAGRWRFDSFPRVGLALLSHMMQTGSHDLVGSASVWEIHRETIQSVRQVYQARYPREPLRLALAEHGYSRYRGFPPSSSSTSEIDRHFIEYAQELVKHYGEGAISPNSGQAVRSRCKEEEYKDIAERFHELHTADPEQFPRSGTGYTAAAAVMADEGFKKVSKTKVESAYTSSDLYLSAVMFGVLKSPKSRR